MGTVRNFQQKSRRGFTLTELALVTGLIGTVLVGLWVAYTSVRESNQVRIGMQELVAIVQNTRTVFAEQGGVIGTAGSGLTASLDQLNVFPTDMRNPASCPAAQAFGCVFNPWGSGIFVSGFTFGSVQVGADNCTGIETATTPQPCFGITFYQVPQTACIKMVMQSSGMGMKLTQIKINGAAVLLPPVTTIAAQLACDDSAGSGRNTILWVYLLKDNQ
jgi:type II secretory pathway pseudopilin PulG